MTKQNGITTAALLLADIKGLGSLTGDEHLTVLVENFYPRIRKVVTPYAPLVYNPWCDAIFCAFADPLAAGRCALDLRDLIRDFDWQSVGLPVLQIHISLHAGKVYLDAPDSLATSQAGLISTQIHFATLLEPVLRAGEVWTSNPFVEFLQSASFEGILTDNLGVKPLAQKWRGQEIHRLRRSTDPILADDNIYDRAETKRIDPVAILLTLYERGDEEQQHNAVRMLGRKDDVRAREKLCAIARDAGLSLLLRLDAVSALGEMRNPGAIPTLGSLLAADEKEDPRLQIACLKALIAIGDAQGGKMLLSVLKHMDEYQEIVIRKTLFALISIRDKTALDLVKDLMQQDLLRGQMLKDALQLFLVVDDRQVASTVVGLLDSDFPQDIQYAALAYLVYCHPQVVGTELARISRDSEQPFDFRRIALVGLASIDTEETRMVLAEIAEAAESLSSYAAQFLVEGQERVEILASELKEDILNESW